MNTVPDASTTGTSGPPAPSAVQAAPQPIPYRAESAVGAAGAATPFLVTVVLLGACIAALHYAKRRGWLARWVVPPPTRPQGDAPLRVEHALRVSARTTVYRVRDGDRTWLLVESLAPVAHLHDVRGNADDTHAVEEVVDGPTGHAR